MKFQRTLLILLYILPVLYISHYLEIFYNKNLKMFFLLFFIIFIIMVLTEQRQYWIKKYLMHVSGHFVFLYMYLLVIFLTVLCLHFFLNVNLFVEQNLIWITAVFFTAYVLMSIKAYFNNSFMHTVFYDIDLKLKEQLTVVAISDLHLNEHTKKDFLKKMAKKINGFEADLVIIGGDLVDSHASRFDPDFANDLKRVRSKFGVYGILGNHEFYGDVDKNIEFFKKCNIKLLNNKSELINNELLLIGRNDPVDISRPPIKDLKLDNKYKTLLMDHRPKYKEALAEKIDIQFSGHTHAGQLFPLNIFYKFIYKYIYGHHEIDNFHIIVSAGLSTAYSPYRTFSQSEIVVINIK